MIEILRTLLNFLISLFSGELPIVYYVWIISLFLIQITQSTLNYKLLTRKIISALIYWKDYSLLLFYCLEEY